MKYFIYTFALIFSGCKIFQTKPAYFYVIVSTYKRHLINDIDVYDLNSNRWFETVLTDSIFRIDLNKRASYLHLAVNGKNACQEFVEIRGNKEDTITVELKYCKVIP